MVSVWFSYFPDKLLEVDEFLISSNHPEYPETGLKVSSKVRVSKITTIEIGLVQRRLGKLGPSLRTEVQTKLIALFGNPID